MRRQAAQRLSNLISLAALYLPACACALWFEQFVGASIFLWLVLVVVAAVVRHCAGSLHGVSWLHTAALASVMTIVSFTFDGVIGSLQHSERDFVEAGVRSPAFLFTLLGIAIAICCLGGVLRDWLMSRLGAASEESDVGHGSP